MAAFSTAAQSGAAGAVQCTVPSTPARASLDLRMGEVDYVHDHDTPGMRSIVNQHQGYVAGPWHLPLGLTVADLAMRFETQFYYSEAPTVGHCAALAEAKVVVGYPEATVYISSDYPAGSCEYEAILAHENEHVAINRAVLQAHQGKFEDALRRVLRSKKAIYTLRKEEARSAYLLELQRQLRPVVAEMVAERNQRNGAIDTRDNYLRLMSQCSHWHDSDLQASGSASPPAAADTGDAAGADQAAPSPAARKVRPRRRTPPRRTARAGKIPRRIRGRSGSSSRGATSPRRTQDSSKRP